MRSNRRIVPMVSGLVLLSAACASLPVRAQVVRIDFDNVPNGTGINSTYLAQGVSFATVNTVDCIDYCGFDGQVHASSNCLDAGPLSPPNVVTIYGPPYCAYMSEAFAGWVQATFLVPADSVCIRVKPGSSSGFGVLRAYNDSFSPIATGYSAPGVTQDICLAASGIKSVRFTGSGTNLAWFDDLVFETNGATPALQRSWGALKVLYR